MIRDTGTRERSMREINHFIDGAAFTGASGRFADVFNPNTGDVQARVQLANDSEMDRAVQSAQNAFEGWSSTNPQRRARVMFEFKQLVEANMNDLAELLSSEHGKVVADSKGDIQRGLEVIEFACGIPHALKGEYTWGAGPGIDVYSMRQPLGVVSGITPFNFPAMIPMWMFGVAIAVGNTFILKPSERDPSVPVRLAELMMEAGAPAGVLNVVHGDKQAVDAILTHPLVHAVSFVGSSDIAHYVYQTGAANHKRVQAMGGAKNHGIVLPDADMDQVIKDLSGAAYGSAGERCMALPVVVPVGKKTADELRERMVAEIPTMRVGVSTDAGAHYGPVVTAQHKARVEGWIDQGVKDGAELVVDERGYFVGPSLFDHVTPEMESYKEEIFGPVLQIVRAATFEEALSLPSKHQYGNGVAIFTQNGRAARDFAARVNVGMVGINVPIPVPVAYHTFGGWKRSSFGDTNQHGMEGVKFWTKVKTVTARWPDSELEHADSSFVIPTMA
jgi:malonate-semialdehyde dehydrogenase (acetylating)/methylmalonate-semialdehyde dehydrogenase